MNNLKKIITITIILLLSALLVIISTKKVFADDNKYKCILDGNGNEIDTSIKSTVWLTQGVTSTFISDGKKHYSALHQTNIYCAQYGAEFDYNNNYSIGEEENVNDDDGLAYILGQTPPNTDMLEKWQTENQLALWGWLYNGISDSVKNILLDINGVKRPYEDYKTFKYKDSFTEDEYNTLYENALALYNKAKNHKQNIKNFNVSIDEKQDNNDEWVYKISGAYDRLIIKVNGEEHDVNQISDSECELEIKKAEYSNCSEVNINVEAYITKYNVSYRLLKLDTSQRLLVVTGITKSELKKDVSRTIKCATDISLQKYIVKVNGSDIESQRNEQMTTTDDETNGVVKTEIAKANNLKASKKYKYDEPVMIENGDTVTYKITIYNNSNVRASKVSIVDWLIEKSGGNGKGYGTFSKIYTLNNNVESEMTLNKYKDKDKYIDRAIIWETENLAGGESRDFYVDVKYDTDYTDRMVNSARIEQTTPPNNTKYRTLDRDYVKMNTYAVSLEKYVSKVNNEDVAPTRAGKAEYLTKKDNEYVDETNSDSSYTVRNRYKYDNVVTVSKGDIVTYTIKVKNDGNTTVKFKVSDKFPNGVKYVVPEFNLEYNEYTGAIYCTEFKDGNGETENKMTTVEYTLGPGEDEEIKIRIKVTEPNISNNILKNVAEIVELKNRNDISVNDTTPYNNKDADYIQLDGSVISGKVWNDKALDKAQTKYNGEKDEEESYLSGITVKLYRDGKGIVATTTTNENGEYSFTNNDLDREVLETAEEQYIKGPKAKGTTRWDGSYYSYYVVFEYDGITYTSTTYTTFGTNDDTDLKSNAREKLNDENFDGNVKESRTVYNKGFSTINSESGIEYTTVNEEGYIPQSKHKYNSSMAMQSSTIKIELKNNTTLENNLKHVNLGLRGRDIFDLELTSDVEKVEVKINNQQGVYKYSNKVTLRKSDLTSETITNEDMANIVNEASNKYVDVQNQKIRKTDIDANNGLQEILVTYKITVQNASITDGTATKITNYYDNKYEFVKAYSGANNNNLTTSDGETGNGYKSIVIATPATLLKQSDKMDIYVVYKLNNPVDLLKDLNVAESLATYNMAEITEYTTSCGEGQTEFTRGLLDKDSAPESANKEQVRLTTTEGQITATTDGNPTTVQYYFSGKDLSKLKYEDDTYATPTLYFVKDGNERKITGTVFEDKTTVDNTTKIKTGNGIMDSGEVGVYGATVQLIEQVDGGKSYITTTGTDGKFEFSGFLPGNYIIKYHYGDTEKTVYLNQNSEGINGKSYNGEDFQATNNTGTYGAEKLNNTENYWYIDNESKGVSTATDNTTRRKEVSKNVTSFTDEKMTVLNNIRDGATGVETIMDIIGYTKMWADTNTMKFEVEKGNASTATNGFAEYEITNMNFGIAEVPVTTIDLQKKVSKFKITDSTGKNTIAGMELVEGKWKVVGDVILAGNNIDVSVENEKLQGARLEVTYTITTNVDTEKNFDNTNTTVSTITGIADYINNNFAYNEKLGDNSKYWELTTHEDIKQIYASQKRETGTEPTGTVDPDGKKYTTVLKAKAENPLLTSSGEKSATITLEKVLTSTDSTIEDVVTNIGDTFQYSNIIEITGLNYDNTGAGTDSKEPQRDRIRTPERYIIIPGVQYDYTTSETIVIHPPTGDSSISIVYYIIAVISLAVLAVGVFGIKKFVISSKN